MTTQTQDPTSPTNPRETIEHLHQLCTETLCRSFDSGYGISMAKSYMFASDLATWCELLSKQPERFLFEKAQQEYVTAILNLAQGQYRNAFKCLRLVLELCIQGVESPRENRRLFCVSHAALDDSSSC